MYKSIVGIALLTLITSFANAAELIPFANGQKTNADDINSNFNELATRINAMPTGTEGPPGADGAGVVTYSWADYSSSNYKTKVYSFPASDPTMYEVVEYTRSSNVDGTGNTTKKSYGRVGIDIDPTDPELMTPIPYKVDHYEWDIAGNFEITKTESFAILNANNALESTSTTEFSPFRLLRTNNMGLGMSWGDASTATNTPTLPEYGTAFDTIGIVAYSLLGVENVSVQGVNYTGCLKIERRYTSYNNTTSTSANRISWRCPNGEGLVKLINISITHRSDGSPSSSSIRRKEFVKNHNLTTPAL